jgi:hypothetical protein
LFFPDGDNEPLFGASIQVNVGQPNEKDVSVDLADVSRETARFLVLSRTANGHAEIASANNRLNAQHLREDYVGGGTPGRRAEM